MLADELADLDVRAVVALETGRYDPSLPLAFRIAEVFGKRIEELFTPGAEPDRGR